MSLALRPFLHASVPGLRVTAVTSASAACEEGAVTLSPRVVWAAGLQEFEHVEVTTRTGDLRWRGHVRLGRDGECALCLPNGRTVLVGEVVKVSSLAWLTEDTLVDRVTSLVTVDECNRVIEFRRVPARTVSLDPDSFPPPPAIEVVAVS